MDKMATTNVYGKTSSSLGRKSIDIGHRDEASEIKVLLNLFKLYNRI